MKTTQAKLSQVKINGDNPRTITTAKFNKLVDSLLVFPKMLGIRPVVVDKTKVALGGNMRLQALKEIAKMTQDNISERLSTIKDYISKTEAEKQIIVQYWSEWLANPTVEIVDASNLTEEEKKQFIIKDNVAYGNWDYDALANGWDNSALQDWGMDVWNLPDQPFATPVQSSQPQIDQTSFTPAEECDNLGGSLPEELQGLDLTPNSLPKIQGTDETLMERIIITYPKEREQFLADFLGLEKIEKVVYKIEEIFPENE